MTPDDDNIFKQIQVLLVDDHDPIRQAMRRLVAGLGVAEIHECKDGETAARRVSKHLDIDLVLCDLYMPRRDGFSLLETVRSQSIRSDIPFIVITGESGRDDIVKASALGADDYIIKPFKADEFTAKIKKVLRQFLFPPPPMAKLRQADRAFISKQLERAIALYREALALDSTSKRASHSLGLALYQNGNVEEAVHLFEANIKSHRSFYKNYASLAQIYLQRKDSNQALHYLTAELEHNPKQPDRQVLAGRLLLEQKNIHAAIERFRTVLRDSPKHPDALLSIGQAYAAGDDLGKALSYFKRLRRATPSSITSLQAIVAACAQHGDMSRAAALLQEEYNQHPNRLDTYPLLARLWSSLGQEERAHEVLARLFRNDADHAEGLRVRSSFAMRAGDYAGALQDLQQLNATRAENDSLVAEADCLVRLEQIDMALSRIFLVLQKDPGHAHAQFLAGCCYAKTEQIGCAYFAFLLAQRAGARGEKLERRIAKVRHLLRGRRRPRD